MHLVTAQLSASLFPSVRRLVVQKQAGKFVVVYLSVRAYLYSSILYVRIDEEYLYSSCSLHTSGMLSEADAAVSAASNVDVTVDNPITLFELRNTLQVSCVVIDMEQEFIIYSHLDYSCLNCTHHWYRYSVQYTVRAYARAHTHTHAHTILVMIP